MVHPTDNTPVRAIQKPIPRARLLTSAASLAAIEKKELEVEARAVGRKREREEKTKQKEQELKRKTSEEGKRKDRKTKTSSTKKVTQDKKEFNIREQAQRGKRRKPPDFDLDIPQAKKSIVTEDGVCCICFGAYDNDVIEQTGAVWIACGCGQWVHEDCVEDVVLEMNDFVYFVLWSMY